MFLSLASPCGDPRLTACPSRYFARRAASHWYPWKMDCRDEGTRAIESGVLAREPHVMVAELNLFQGEGEYTSSGEIYG